MPVVLSGTNGVTFPDSSLQAAAASPYVLKNRIINGDMRIDQRNAGASVTITANPQYSLDRFQSFSTQASKFSVQKSSTAPTGFTNSAKITSLSAYTVGSAEGFTFGQTIEGNNIADLGWGTASAKTVTLSFQVQSSLTGTFGGALSNGSFNRSYPFTYTISSANTWTTISITIAGDTTGTWFTDNQGGIQLFFGLGVGSTLSGTAGSWSANGYFSATGATSVVGTNGATFYITGVQLEIGTSATPFERRLYGQELANCQRYCYGQYNSTSQAYYFYGTTAMISSTLAYGGIFFPVTMRTKPSITATVSNTFFVDNFTPNSNAVILDQAGVNGGFVAIAGSGGTTGQSGRFLSDNTDQSLIIWSAEL